jgi:hypothetical protein
MTWFDHLKAEVKAFLEKATKEEIQAALERANYALYKDIDVPIFAFHEMVHEWIGRRTFRASFRISEQIITKGEHIYLKEMAISADNYGYSLAA